MKALICGGRDFCNPDNEIKLLNSQSHYMCNRLDMLMEQRDITFVVHGAAPGADQYAGSYMMNKYLLPTLAVPADWDKYGNRAGYLRNQKMLDLVAVDIVIAFPGGRGTAMMMDLATRAGVKKITDLEDDYLSYFLGGL